MCVAAKLYLREVDKAGGKRSSTAVSHSMKTLIFVGEQACCTSAAPSEELLCLACTSSPLTARPQQQFPTASHSPSTSPLVQVADSHPASDSVLQQLQLWENKWHTNKLDLMCLHWDHRTALTRLILWMNTKSKAIKVFSLKPGAK